jgi:hypothetical protein
MMATENFLREGWMAEAESWSIGEISAERFKQIPWNEAPASSIPEYGSVSSAPSVVLLVRLHLHTELPCSSSQCLGSSRCVVIHNNATL